VKTRLLGLFSISGTAVLGFFFPPEGLDLQSSQKLFLDAGEAALFRPERNRSLPLLACEIERRRNAPIRDGHICHYPETLTHDGRCIRCRCAAFPPDLKRSWKGKKKTGVAHSLNAMIEESVINAALAYLAVARFHETARAFSSSRATPMAGLLLIVASIFGPARQLCRQHRVARYFWSKCTVTSPTHYTARNRGGGLEKSVTPEQEPAAG